MDPTTNKSDVCEFVLLGFPGLPERFHVGFGVFLFLVYNVSLCANTMVIILILCKEHLHQPMYIIIASLAISDLLFDTTTLPKIIAKYWFGAGSLTFVGCFLQMTVVHTFNPLDSFIIMFMAIDRYVAICHPLRYHSIIGNRRVIITCISLYTVAVLTGVGVMYLATTVPYAGSNKVKNLFCSIGTVGATTYINPAPLLLKAYYVGLACHLGPLSFIVFSYSIIIRKICSSVRSESWNKAIYTCVTHWFVIGTYNVPRLLVYTYEQTQKPQVDIYVSLICLYTFVPHFTSPIIFCLRNEEIKKTLRSAFERKKMNSKK